MSSGRVWVHAFLAALVATFVAVGADALVETDEERIDRLADGMVGSEERDRLAVLLTSVDPSRQWLVVRTGEHVEEFDEHSEDPAPAIREALSALENDSLEVVQRSVSIDDDDAHLALRVRSAGELVDAQVELRKNGQSWLVREVRVLR